MKKIILDTDLGTDSDDIGALMILHNFMRRETVKLIGVTSCLGQKDSAVAIDVINRYYNNVIPVGKCGDEKKFANAEYGSYARAISFFYPSPLKTHPIPDAVKVLRKLLAENSGVTLVTIGMLNNIRDLIDSPPDEISGLNGRELLKTKVERAYIMGGRFDAKIPEWNIYNDTAAAKIVAETLDEIIFIPYETGVRVLTGDNILKGVDTPMKCGYYVHNIVKRESWDPIAAYLAATDSQLFGLSGFGRVRVESDGVTVFQKGEGRHRYVLADFDAAEVEKELEKYMTA